MLYNLVERNNRWLHVIKYLWIPQNKYLLWFIFKSTVKWQFKTFIRFINNSNFDASEDNKQNQKSDWKCKNINEKLRFINTKVTSLTELLTRRLTNIELLTTKLNQSILNWHHFPSSYFYFTGQLNFTDKHIKQHFAVVAK